MAAVRRELLTPVQPTLDREVTVGEYTVVGRLGAGGMGVVLEARDRLGSPVAIKILCDGLAEHPELVERFEREARVTAALASPHTVRVFDIGRTDEGKPYFVMELLRGRDLAQILVEDGPRPQALAAMWIMQACRAVRDAHDQGVVHRDIKPSNLFLSAVRGGSVLKVLDFGIAKTSSRSETPITLPLAQLGTPQYMSPEQVRNAREVDERSDVWSLGVCLYELVTGRAPFNFSTPSACIAAIAADEVEDPRMFVRSLSPAFVEVVFRALAKDPQKRFPTAEAFARALRPFAAVVPDVDREEGLVTARTPSAVFAVSVDIDAAARSSGTRPSALPSRESYHPTLASAPSLPPQERRSSVPPPMFETSPSSLPAVASPRMRMPRSYLVALMLSACFALLSSYGLLQLRASLAAAKAEAAAFAEIACAPEENASSDGQHEAPIGELPKVRTPREMELLSRCEVRKTHRSTPFGR